MSTEFKREERYIIFKLSDVEEHFTPGEKQQLERLVEVQRAGREEVGKPPLECVVVESDWPEYEATWSTIEARVTGAQPALTTGLGGTFRAMGNNAYCACIQQMRREVCLGEWLAVQDV